MPLAIALLNVSNPTLGAMDALSRLSHDTDAEVAQNAVVSLGVFFPCMIHCCSEMHGKGQLHVVSFVNA